MRGKFWGAILILLGVLGLLDGLLNLNLLTMGNFWPAIILGIGFIFEYGYFSDKKNPGLLVPGGIMTVLGLLFFFETFTDWNFSEYTWPIYIPAAIRRTPQNNWIPYCQKNLLYIIIKIKINEIPESIEIGIRSPTGFPEAIYN
jgi:hypothetical protein